MKLRTLFSDRSCECYTLHVKYVVLEDAVSSTFPKVHERGEKQLNKFLRLRFWNRSKAVSYTVTKNGV